MAEHTYTKGQPVRVFDINGRRRGQPEGGWEGTIISIGRTLLRIEYPGWPADRQPQSFRMDTQRASDDSMRRFQTLDQFELAERRRRALAFLAEYDLHLRGVKEPDLEILEAAAAGIERHLNPVQSVERHPSSTYVEVASYEPMAED